METEQKHFWKSFLLLLGFYSCCFILFLIAGKMLDWPPLLAEKNFLNWDAMHYNTIRTHGYETGMVAFFPLFPLVWKLSFMGSIMISLVNGLIYLCSFSWLAGVFQIDNRKLMLLASVPVLMFMFLPYSEAVFFLGSVMLLAGLKKNISTLAIAGILLAGLSRPVSTVFIPAIFILHFLTGTNSRKEWSHTINLILACLGSLLLVFTVQYIETGSWFSFFKVQKEWGNYLRLPVFPLNSWAGGFILRLDAIAFLTGIAATGNLVYLIHKKRKTNVMLTNKPLIFSLAYLSLLTLIVLITRGGILNSLNRYLFCTAFFLIFLNTMLQTKFFSGKNMLIVFFGSGVFWLLFGSYVHIQTILKFMLLSLYLLLLIAATAEKKIIRNIAYASVITCNIFLMVVFFHRFLAGEWVG